MADNKYEKIPVVYCDKCLSLGIKEEEGYDICQQCRNDSFELADDIFVWEKMFEEKYTVKYLAW